jgi:hypothetical protein
MSRGLYSCTRCPVMPYSPASAFNRSRQRQWLHVPRALSIAFSPGERLSCRSGVRVGRPTKGHDHPIDSNIDGGPDLLSLRDSVVRHPEARPLDLEPLQRGCSGLVEDRR